MPVASDDKVIAEVERDSTKPKEGSAENNKAVIADFGLEVQPLTSELAKPLGIPSDVTGLVVTSVKEGSSAAENGMQEGDVITKVVISNRKIQPMTSVKSFQELAAKSSDLAVRVQRGKDAAHRHTSSKTALAKWSRRIDCQPRCYAVAPWPAK